MKIYKIRNTITGLYSLGGQYVSWGKKGKVWTTNSGLSNHFNLVGYDKVPRVYANCEIVEYELTENEVNSLSITEWSNDAYDRHVKAELLLNKKIRDRQLAHAKELADKANRDFERLSRKG